VFAALYNPRLVCKINGIQFVAGQENWLKPGLQCSGVVTNCLRTGKPR